MICIFLETLEKGTYEYTMCHLKSEEVPFKINYEIEIEYSSGIGYDTIDPYSDGDWWIIVKNVKKKSVKI